MKTTFGYRTQQSTYDWYLTAKSQKTQPDQPYQVPEFKIDLTVSMKFG